MSTPEKLNHALRVARGVSYSAGASGLHFFEVIRQLGIEAPIVDKRVAAKPGEVVGAVVARDDADSEAASAFVDFLRSSAAQTVLRHKGLDPV